MSAASPSPAPAAGETPRAGGPPGWLIVLAVGSLVLGAILVGLSALGVSVGRPAAEATPAPAGEAAQVTWDQAAAALQARSFQVQEPQTAYRPGESPSLVDVPRKLLQVVLPSAPAGEYVVIYELPTNGDADRVGRDFAAYLGSGTGAVQYPRDARFVLQRSGRTLLFFAWSAEANPDPRLPELAAALQTVGTPVTP